MSQEQKIAHDPGYGDNKDFHMKDGKPVEDKFPSAIARVKEAQVEFGGPNTFPDTYTFNGKKYVIGERARNDAVSTRGFNFLEKYSPLSAYHAIKRAGFDTKLPIHIVTGLSILNWDKADSFIEIMSTIKVDEDVIKPRITLLAQGQGVFHDYEGDKNGLVGVVDIGYNTFDFLVFENGKPRQDLSFAAPIGVNKIITDLQASVNREYKTSITEQAAKEIFMSGKLLHFGEEVEFTDQIKEQKEEYGEFIIDELRARCYDTLKDATKIIFSGGGAYFLDKETMPKNVDFSKPPYEFANVRGYYKYHG